MTNNRARDAVIAAARGLYDPEDATDDELITRIVHDLQDGSPTITVIDKHSLAEHFINSLSEAAQAAQARREVAGASSDSARQAFLDFMTGGSEEE